MSAASTHPRPEAATPQWLLPALSSASSIYLHILLGLSLVTVIATFAAGLTPHIISTGSMQPAIRPGDIVLINDGVDRATLGAGAVITFEHPQRRGSLVTHRITALNGDGSYTTKGDANRVDDPYSVPPENIVGVGQLVVPLVGLPATWLRHGMLLEFALFLLASVVAFAGATLTVGEDDERGAGPQPRRPRGVGASAPRRLVTWAVQQVAVVAALATVVLMSGVVVLERRTGAVFTDRLLAVVELGAIPVSSWRLVALAMVALAGFVAVRVVLPGVGWETTRSRLGIPEGVASRLAWVERNGSTFVAVLAIFVMTGAGTALAHTATGEFLDAETGGSDQFGADIIGGPSNPSASASCNDSDAVIGVSWSTSSDAAATGYEILRSTTTGGPYDSAGTVSDPAATAFTDTSLSYSTTYYYVVRTTTATAWVSPWTTEVSATTPDCSPPDMWIGALSGSSSTKDATHWTATATAEVSTDAGVLSGAAVSGRWDDLTGALLGTSSCTTDAAGTCSVTMDPLLTTSEVTFTVTDVSEPGHEYVSSRNATSTVAISAP